MLKRVMQVGRSHPILAASAIGALAGGVNVILLESGALPGGNAGGVLTLLFSSPAVSSRIGHISALQVAFLLLIEVAGNVLVFVLLFAVPVAAIAGTRRVLQRRKTNALH